jgi:hypothetical protein
MRMSLFTVVLVLGMALPVLAQPAEEPNALPTKLETFLAQQGAVIVRGSSRVGEMRGREGAAVVVDAQEATTADNGEKQYGLTITVKSSGASPAERMSYLDYEEIGPLVRALDAIAKVDRSATQLAEFRADYRTRDGLEISTYSAGQLVKAAVSSGHRTRVTAFFQWSDLAKFKDLVVQAKTTIDSTKQ